MKFLSCKTPYQRLWGSNECQMIKRYKYWHDALYDRLKVLKNSDPERVACTTSDFSNQLSRQMALQAYAQCQHQTNQQNKTCVLNNKLTGLVTFIK